MGDHCRLGRDLKKSLFLQGTGLGQNQYAREIHESCRNVGQFIKKSQKEANMDKILTQKKCVIAIIHIFDNNFVTFWIYFNTETQTLHDHWLYGCTSV